MTAPSVFISYSHDSAAHRARVLGLSERLRRDGIATSLDQYLNGAPPKPWPQWMLDQLDAATFVLVVCTETYHRRFRGREEPGRGKGAAWEGAVITQEIYDARGETLRFVPVLFAPEDERHIPEPLRGRTHYTLTSDAAYEALYDFLLEQAGVEPGPVGELRRKERPRGEPLAFGDAASTEPATGGRQRIAPSRLPHAGETFVGRDDELARLDATWADPQTHVVTIVAWGGVGKTSLVSHWQAALAARDYDGASYFDWSFFSQGAREQAGASSEPFLAAALAFFGEPELAQSPRSALEKAARLAELVAARRTLLVLDGLEPLQYPPGPMGGMLKDAAMATLLRGLAQRNAGLCVVTTRERVAELAHFHQTTAPEWELQHLSVPAGVALLRRLGVQGTEAELGQLVRDVDGHALTLTLVGSYLKRAYKGDVRRRDRVRFEKADAQVQGGHAFKAMAAYERWLGESGEMGARQLAVLRLLGLFDRPADAAALAALRAAPAIAGLTEPLVERDEEEWNLTVADLAACDLVAVPSAQSTIGDGAGALDAHPLVREYFAKRLREERPDAWRSAHGRLFEHLKESTEYRPDTLEGLQPLYQAVVHGCLAGRHREACEEVYLDRIQRKDEFYSFKKLGAFGMELSAVAAFFEQPWRRVSPALREDQESWLLNEAGFCLRALGRLIEAREPMQAGLQGRIGQEGWTDAAAGAGNLTELELTLGEISAAVRHAQESVTYADRSANAFWRSGSRTTLADALHQAGEREEALTLFREAEAMQSDRQSQYPLLYSLQGFRYCDLLLAGAEREAWQVLMSGSGHAETDSERSGGAAHLATCRDVEQRATRTLAWASRHLGLLDVALDHLTLGRAALFAMLLCAAGSLRDQREMPELVDDASSHAHLAAAADGLRRAGQQDYLLRGLLTRACLRVVEGNPAGARDDLDEAWQIAERGPMRLHLADVHLHRARLFHAVTPYPWESPHADLAAARTLIEQCGYGRRRGELADAEAAARTW